ncbi:MAG TPA: hypothetical protein VF844_13565 [Ktedonobacteraceae bacterium]
MINQSEVARLHQQIELQLEAMRRGMSGLARGRARHSFIRAQMDRIGACQDELAAYVGERIANQVISSLYVEVMERER